MQPYERPKAVLRALIAFAKERDRWPDARELREYRRRLGGRTVVYAALRHVADLGLAEQRGHASTSRWVPTAHGFEIIGKPPFRPALEIEHERAASALILDRTIPSPAPTTAPRAIAAAARDIDVYG